jgi:hypothetical protein
MYEWLENTIKISNERKLIYLRMENCIDKGVHPKYLKVSHRKNLHENFRWNFRVVIVLPGFSSFFFILKILIAFWEVKYK